METMVATQTVHTMVQALRKEISAFVAALLLVILQLAYETDVLE